VTQFGYSTKGDKRPAPVDKRVKELLDEKKKPKP
jgi:hypothetical protein